MSEEKKVNPFEALAKIYDEGVKKGNELGYGEVFRLSTLKFFDDVREELASRFNLTFTVEDIVWGNGYFIFGYGDNTNIHFHIKEVPGFLFAIWWDTPKEKYDPVEGRFEGTFFTQFEAEIDKFKPSRSAIQHHLHASWHDNNADTFYIDGSWEVASIINFMITEPALAWARDQRDWDYNIEYHTREEAQKEYDEYVEWRERKDRLSAEWDHRCIKAVYDALKDEIDAGVTKIIDRGECVSPRYEIVVDLDSCLEEGGPTEKGNYGLIWDDETCEKMTSVWDECEKDHRGDDFCWWKPFNESCFVVSHDTFEQVKGMDMTPYKTE